MASVRGVAALCHQVGALTLGARPACALLAPAALGSHAFLQVRNTNIYKIDQPKPGDKRNYRYKVHFPEDGKYTVRPLKTTKLGGRDPETGRIIVGTLGGGAKRHYRWIDWFRTGPTDGTFLEERVIRINYDPNRSARIALVATGNNLRYILASENMKSGDLIKTSSFIPRIPVRPKEGDAYPVGALPVGTVVHCVEIMPGDGARKVKAAGTSGIIMRKIGKKVVVQMPSKAEVALDLQCMATVGRVSNINHGQKHVGSAQRRRWLGKRPASGLWQRKDGYCGRKIKPLPPIKSYGPRKEDIPWTQFTLETEGPRKKIIPSTDRVT